MGREQYFIDANIFWIVQIFFVFLLILSELNDHWSGGFTALKTKTKFPPRFSYVTFSNEF